MARTTAAGMMLTVLVPTMVRAQPAAVGDSVAIRGRDVDRLVREGNPAWRLAGYDVALARGDVTTARLRPNPSMSVVADVVPQSFKGYRLAQQQASLSLAMPFERGNKRALRSDVAEKTMVATGARTEDVLREQLFAARSAWQDLLGARAAEAIARSTLDTYERLVTVSRARLAGRQISDAEFARIVVERGRAAVTVDGQRDASAQAASAVAGLLGFAGPLTTADTLTPLPVRSLVVDTLVARALAIRSDVAMARQMLDVTAADEKLQAALAKQDPTVSLDAVVQQGVQMYGSSVSVPLAWFQRNQGEREKAQVRSIAAREQLRQVERLVRLDVQRAVDAVRVRQTTLARFEDTSPDGILARARVAQTAAEFAYRNGATSLVELLDAERSYDEVRRAYVDAIVDLNKSLVALAHAVGVAVEELP
jgi:cobalt-zinc-cadmium efflux system outer membrane protein